MVIIRVIVVVHNKGNNTGVIIRENIRVIIRVIIRVEIRVLNKGNNNG